MINKPMTTCSHGLPLESKCNQCVSEALATESKRIKPKRCKACRNLFRPARPLQTACGDVCARKLAERARTKREARAEREIRKDTRQKLEALKPISYWAKIAERAVNRYVRARDSREGCISCDKPSTWDGQWHASHFRSVGASSAVRFNTFNIHKACWICNKLYSGRIGDYTPRLIAKIGQDRVDWLKEQTHTVKFTREYLQRMAKIFNKRARMVEKRRELR